MKGSKIEAACCIKHDHQNTIVFMESALKTISNKHRVLGGL